jgi:hypothetical protein
MWSSWRPLDGPVTPWIPAAYNHRTTPPLNWHSIVPRTKNPAAANTSVTLHNFYRTRTTSFQPAHKLYCNGDYHLAKMHFFTAGIFNLVYTYSLGCKAPFWGGGGGVKKNKKFY